MEDITSKQGAAHVTSTQFRAILASILGSGSFIANQDDLLEPELAANNVLNIHSGVLIHHGSVRRVPPGTYDQVTYLNGTQAMQRIDLVVARYTKSEDIETSEWVVIQGTPAASDPEVPAYTEGNMQEGDLVDDCPVFELHFDGINVTEVKTLLEVSDNVEDIRTQISELESSLETKITVNALAIRSKQDAITVKSKSGKTATLAAQTVGAITSLSLTAGTWLVFGGARFPSNQGTETGQYQYKICLSTSSTFDASTESTGINIVDSRAWSLNCWGIFTLTTAANVYLLGYEDSSSSRAVDNGRMTALKLA